MNQMVKYTPRKHQRPTAKIFLNGCNLPRGLCLYFLKCLNFELCCYNKSSMKLLPGLNPELGVT